MLNVNLQDLITESYRILDNVVRQHEPSHIIPCFSGGYDSMVSTHITVQWQRLYCHSANVVTMSADTGIAADGWREFVTDAARQMGVRRFEVWDNINLEDWFDTVRERGFPYRKSHHKITFYYLKQRQFRAIMKHYKKHRQDRIVFVDGIRRAESKERAKTEEWKRYGSGVWANPILYWPDEAVHQYRAIHNLPINPFYDVFGNSGDCLCDWHNQIALEIVKQHAPRAYTLLGPLDAVARELHQYGYDDEPPPVPDWEKLEEAGQLRLFDFDSTPNLCAGCENRTAPSNSDLDFVMAQRMNWGE